MLKQKAPKDYFFYCVICGEPFQARRYDARTDSDECRLTLSLITRELKLKQFSSDKTITPEQKETVQAQVESATGTGRVLKKLLKSEKTKTPEVDINTPKEVKTESENPIESTEKKEDKK